MDVSSGYHIMSSSPLLVGSEWAFPIRRNNRVLPRVLFFLTIPQPAGPTSPIDTSQARPIGAICLVLPSAITSREAYRVPVTAATRGDIKRPCFVRRATKCETRPVFSRPIVLRGLVVVGATSIDLIYRPLLCPRPV